MMRICPRSGVCRLLFLTLLCGSSAGCGQLLANAKQAFADDLSATILDYDDPATIRQAVPAYLVLISSLIRGEPDNTGLLDAGARLYGAYASAFVEPGESRKALSANAFDYASRSLCLKHDEACDMAALSYDDFVARLPAFTRQQAGDLFLFASSWVGVIQANSGDWNQVAQLPKARAAIQRVIELDERVSNGDAYLYLAVMDTLLPPALGGKPEVARKNFEKAMDISSGKNLMAQVLFAEKYARLLFDRELHDRLLQQVVSTPLDDGGGHRLVNALAKQKARTLLDSAGDYF